ncbi:MAG: hypothetical protein WCL39_13025 [Armatimonadota bacterium]
MNPLNSPEVFSFLHPFSDAETRAWNNVRLLVIYKMIWSLA